MRKEASIRAWSLNFVPFAFKLYMYGKRLERSFGRSIFYRPGV